jgi:hypothetical protein
MVRFLVKGCVNKIEVTTYGGGFEQLPLSRGRNYLFKNYQGNSGAQKHCCATVVVAYYSCRFDSSSFNKYSSDALFLLQIDASNEPLMLCQTLNRAPGKAAVAEKN